MTQVKGFSMAGAQSRVADGQASAQIMLIQGAPWGSHLVLAYLPPCPSLGVALLSGTEMLDSKFTQKEDCHPPALARGRAPPRAGLTLEVDVGVEEQGAVWAGRCQGPAHIPPRRCLHEPVDLLSSEIWVRGQV